EVALAATEALAGEVHGDERGGAGGVHRERRPFEPEDVCKPSCSEAEARAAREVCVERLRTEPGHEELAVFAARDADEDAGRASAQAVRGQGGVLEGLPGHLEEEPLLRIERERLARRDLEETCSKVLDVLEEAGLARVALAGRAGERRVPAVDV